MAARWILGMQSHLGLAAFEQWKNALKLRTKLWFKGWIIVSWYSLKKDASTLINHWLDAPPSEDAKWHKSNTPKLSRDQQVHARFG